MILKKEGINLPAVGMMEDSMGVRDNISTAILVYKLQCLGESDSSASAPQASRISTLDSSEPDSSFGCSVESLASTH